jgi:hypothetical protein
VNRTTAIAALLAAGTLLEAAVAQPPAPLREPLRRPSYSPYLNLTRPGGGPVQNYYGLVRPQVDFQNNLNQLRRDTQSIATGLAESQPTGELLTGHATGFMTHSRYFGTNGAGARGGATGRAGSTTMGGGGVRAPRSR